MVQMLVSVRSVEEADLALQNGVDILDLKDPVQGALGALTLAEIKAIINFAGDRTPISATIGDLPMLPDLIEQGISRFRDLPLSYLKIGFFEALDYKPCLAAICRIKAASQPLIAVLFAEYTYPEHLLAEIKQAGFIGVMLDTVNKNGKTYVDYYSETRLEALIEEARRLQFFFGIAGSLNLSHISTAKKLNPDFLGFRGGVCSENLRQLNLDAVKINAIKNALY
jgi:uncharacterized protein (UPF0264 family)